MFSKILVANRGEIAVRIIRACKEMGILSVAVFSEADRDSLHVSLADESICIGPAHSRDSYLNMQAILSTALATGCEAIHPGYGFLSENATFAGLCDKCGIVFIGPPAEVIAGMGDKNKARETMLAAGVPVVPGCSAPSSFEAAKAEADKIGYPLLVKASAGGGGKGIRLVNEPKELEKAYTTASTEAMSAFGDGGVYLEKYLTSVKHIEMQILCDQFGNTVCLGERECSIQYKRQKLLEESPSASVTESIRKSMMDIARKVAKAIGYVNAGTIEFLLDPSGHFYFMEMNTRLQVEHPVTEMVTGIDLVKWQIRIASGVPLNFVQDEINIKGNSIECRINAIPGTPGQIDMLHVPGGPWVRFDTALYQNYTLPPFYDSMVGKLIVYAKTREEAIRKMQAALCELVIEGIEHNASLQMDILSDARFKSGQYDTDFIQKLY